MAKKTNADNDESVSYLGEQVDPALQEKVKDYMEYREEKKPNTVPESDEVEPLLPADKLPISIAVKDHDEQTEEIPEPEPAPKEPDPVAAALAPVKPAEKTAPELPSAPEVAAIEEPPAEEPEPETEKISEEPELDEDLISEAAEEVASEEQPPEEVPKEDIPEQEVEPTEPAADPAGVEPELPEPKQQTPEDELGLETTQTDRAVEDIVAQEADDVLAAEDEKRGAAPAVVAKKPNKKDKKKKKRSIKRVLLVLIIIVLLAAGGIAANPSTRYEVLNRSGVRAATSLRVTDAKTGQPLKNVTLSIGDRSAKTGEDGSVVLNQILLGPQVMSLKKPGFAEQNKTVTFGWGSNPIGDFMLEPTGSQYTIKLTDFLSGLPVVNAEVVAGESSAVANDKGEAVLTVPAVETESLEVRVNAENYRSEAVTIAADQKDPIALSLVPARQQAFVSKRSGTFDLYKSDVDGKNETKLLAGTGLEREDALAIAAHRSKNTIAFMSTRENIRTAEGVLLSVLQIINLDTGEQTRVTQSERIQVLDWIGDRLVYVKITEGAPQDSKERHKIISYDIRGGGERELASSNYFNDVLSANGAVYYSPAMFNVNGSVGLFKINPDATDKKSLYQKEVWNLFRTSYDVVSVSVGQEWFDLNLSNDVLTKAPGPPSMLKSRVYNANLASNKSLWIDERDGKSTLILYENETKKDTMLRSQAGIKTPLRWISDQHIVYRVANGEETADYVMNIQGGEPKKIVDVTNTLGVDRWYYY